MSSLTGDGDVWFKEPVAGLIMAQGEWWIEQGVVTISDPRGQRDYGVPSEGRLPVIEDTPYGYLTVPLWNIAYMVER